MPVDFKKTEKHLYQPKTVPSIIDVPEMLFFAVDGKGNPNTSAEYAFAIEMLYGLSYAIKMSKMRGDQPENYFDFVVPPLEGFWNVNDDSFRGGGAAIIDKEKFEWTMLIRQPDFVTPKVLEWAKDSLIKKAPYLNLTKARLEKIAEGLCVQVMHIGAYDDEPATVAAMDNYAIQNGYVIDINDKRRHHEIYLSDPRRTEPKNLKTIIRHPVKQQ